MLVSSNRKPSLTEFSKLVFSATDYLNNDAIDRTKYYATRNAQKLEEDVLTALSTVAVGTSFENTIEIVSGQRFPDIVANKYYGIEVKSSTNDRWTTLGGSVNESTRIEGVERIFLTFGKLISPIEFKSRPYEECLSDVVVTHYPRYSIDMNLIKGKTIFDKMNISYDELRTNGNAVGTIVQYYKTQLKDGERLWWIDSGEASDNTSASMTVKLWRTLSPNEKHNFMISGYAFFPSLLSNSNAKYEDFSLWLASCHGILSTSLRDIFSAGGRETLYTQNRLFERVPQALCKIFHYKSEIFHEINTANKAALMENWHVQNINDDRVGQWIDLVSYNYLLNNKNEDAANDIFAVFGEDRTFIHLGG